MLIVSALCNAVMSLGIDVSVLKFVWFVNGAAQSMLWCTIIEMLSKKVPPEHKNRAILTMSTTTAIGTTAAYSVSAGCIALGHVFWTFRTATLALLAICGVWLFITRNLSKMEDAGVPHLPNVPAESAKPDSIAVLLAGAGGAIFCTGILAVGNGFIRDTMVTWVPSLLYDKFGLPSQYSVLITLLLPLLSIFGAAIGVALHRRVRSYYSLLGIVYAMSAVVLAGCFLAYLAGGFLSYPLYTMVFLIAFAALNGCFMATANNIVTSMIPLERKSGSGLFAGIMDAFCYVGSTASGILPGLLLERSENGFTVLLLLVPAFALVLTAFAFVLRLRERAKTEK